MSDNSIDEIKRGLAQNFILFSAARSILEMHKENYINLVSDQRRFILNKDVEELSLEEKTNIFNNLVIEERKKCLDAFIDLAKLGDKRRELDDALAELTKD